MKKSMEEELSCALIMSLFHVIFRLFFFFFLLPLIVAFILVNLCTKLPAVIRFYTCLIE